MKLSIFSRLVIGYLTIFFLAITVSVYAVMQLRKVETVTRSILEVNNRVLDYELKLADVFLSMINYERKYIITRDEELYGHFAAAANDFNKYLKEMASVADAEYSENAFDKIALLSGRYVTSFTEEVGYVKAGLKYPVERYRLDKENTANEIMNELRALRDFSQQNTYDKVEKLGAAEGNARKIVIVMGLVSLIAGTIISVFITVNITKPLSLIQKKTRDVARGEFGSDLKITSPPEIMELTHSFNTMCAKLKELDRMKSDFFSLMSHELRTPLTTIKEGTALFWEGLKQGPATEKQKRLLTIINEECIRLINLVNSLLDLSKMEAGMMVYNFVPGDIAALIKKVVREMEPLMDKNKIVMETDISYPLPPVKFDMDRMLQALRNMVGNAVKFTPGGGTVTLSAHATDKEVVVSVADTGVGISKEKIDIIFNKYQRAVLADSGKITGSGLGLFIVKQIITAHGGKISVESTPDKGSTFTFVLPA